MVRKDVNSLKRKTRVLPVFRHLKDEELEVGLVYYVKNLRLDIYSKCIYCGMITIDSVSKYCFIYGTISDWDRSMIFVLPRRYTIIYGFKDPE